MIDFDYKNFLNFNFYIFIVISFDIFSYIVGKLIGYNKLTKVSPNKTLEGFLGGIIISLITSYIFANFIDMEINLSHILFTLCIIISAFIGDILESYFKRKNNLKNSSELIPGHGGIFDRFDSFLFSIIIYSISTNL